MNSSNQPEEFPLSVAGLPITLKFWPIKDYPREKRRFKRSLLQYLQQFKSAKHSGIHTVINVVDSEDYQIVFNKTSSFAELAHYKDSHTIEMQYQISIAQFFMTLSNLLSALLHQNNGIVLHASACLIDGNAHIFMGAHGAGKSTIVRMLRNKFIIVADDLIFIKKMKNKYVMYQTPNIEKPAFIKKNNSPYLIGGIYLLKQTAIPYIRKLNNQRSMESILSNMLFKPKEKEAFVATVFDLLSKKPITYELGFNLDTNSVITILEAAPQ